MTGVLPWALPIYHASGDNTTGFAEIDRMPQLLKRPQAEEDLLDIWRHIARDNPDAADAWIDQLGETALRLAGNREKEGRTSTRNSQFSCGKLHSLLPGYR